MITLIGGVPATGKTSYAKLFCKGMAVLEFDDWVRGRYPGQGIHEATALFHLEPDGMGVWLDRIRREPGDVAVCDTWVYRADRRRAIEALGVDRLVYLTAPLDVLMKRNAGREVRTEALITLFLTQDLPVAKECRHVEVLTSDLYHQ